MSHIGRTFINFRRGVTAMGVREKLRHLLVFYGYPEKMVTDFTPLLESGKLVISFNGTTNIYTDGTPKPGHARGPVVKVGTKYLTVLTPFGAVEIKPEEADENFTLTLTFSTEEGGVDDAVL